MLYVVAGIIASIPILLDAYGIVVQGYCWIPGNTTFRVYFRFFALFGIVWICLIYSTVQKNNS